MKSIAINTLISLVITVAFFYSLYPFSELSSILLWDETVSLEKGIDGSFSYFNYESSPLYAHFYQFLGLFAEDPKELYLLNHGVLFFSFLFLLALTVMVYTNKLIFAFIIAALFVYLPGYHIWPRVNFFTCIYLLVLLLAIYPIKRFSIKVAITTVASYLLIFLRPEFFLSFYIFYFLGVGMLIYAIHNYYKKNEWKSDTTYLLTVLVAVSILMMFFITPSVSDSDRSFIAFSQHYSLGVHQAEGLETSPWHIHKIIKDRDFPGADSLFSALQINPNAFIGHVINNLTKCLLFCLGIIGFIYLYMAIANRKILPKRWSPDAIILMGFLAPIVLGVLLIYPRLHYLLVMLILLVIFTALFFKKRSLSNKRIAISLTSLLLILFILPPNRVLPNKDVENQLAMLGEIEKELSLGDVLGADGGLCVYLNTCQSSIGVDKEVTTDWIKENIDTIFITNGLLETSEDKEIQFIIQKPELYGFTERQINEDLYLLIKN